MFEQERVSASVTPGFLRNAKGVEYVTGNPTLDASKFTNGQEVKAGTAIYKQENGLYDLAENFAGEGAMPNGVLTVENVTVKDNTKNVHVGAISKGNIDEKLTHGVTDAFKQSNGLFFWY